MLLVVIAPLISRAIAHPMAGSVHSPVAHAGHHLEMDPATLQPANAYQMHHDMGHSMDHAVPMMPDPMDAVGSDTEPSESVAPHAEHEMGADCEYCLIAARMISLLVALLLLLTTWRAIFRALVGLTDTRRIPATGTLGARGPPLAFAR